MTDSDAERGYPGSMCEDQARVGVFWGVYEPGGTQALVAESQSLGDADPYGECLTFSEGHAEVWARLRRARALPAATRGLEYDAVPRGRVVYHRPSNSFWVYADRRLHGASFVARVIEEFALIGCEVQLKVDSHYR